MRSITARFTALIIVAILCSVAIVGGFSAAMLRHKADIDAASILNLTCANEAQNINTTLSGIEQSVNLEASYASDEIEDIQRFFKDENYRKAFTKQVESLFREVASQTEGAVTFYFRYNAEEIDSTEGFLYTRNNSQESFSNIPLTDMSLYSSDDDEHVGWYYIPLANGKPTWMFPYQNKNLDIYMISYVVPLFKEGEFIGVIGMDVNFDIVVSQLKEIHPYGSGYAALVGTDGTIYYHPSLELGLHLDGSSSGLPDIEAYLNGSSSGDELISYTYKGDDKRLVFRQLKNNMDLALVAEADAIDTSRNHLIINLVVAMLLIMAVFICLAVVLGRLLFKPLHKLTIAAEEISHGNLEVELPEKASKEVSTLLTAYRSTVDRMRDQLHEIDELAHRDGLTGLLNKAAYNERSEITDQLIRDQLTRLQERNDSVSVLQSEAEDTSTQSETQDSSTQSEEDDSSTQSETQDSSMQGETQDGGVCFALAMVDVNDLKVVNDTRGHEEGDAYLKSVVKLMREIFTTEKLYRVGGDEFIVWAEGEQVNLLQDKVHILEEKSLSGTYDYPVVACGVAVFDRTKESAVAEVFRRADEAMYKRKQEIKAHLNE